MTTKLGDMDENGVSGLEEDELNLENYILELDSESKSSYQITYQRLIAELSEYMENSKKELSADTVSWINNQIWSLVDEWGKQA